MRTLPEFVPSQKQHSPSYRRALGQVGKMAEFSIQNTLDEIRLLQEGVSPLAVEALANFFRTTTDLNWVIPRRTLTQRKNKREKLTLAESERWLRAAKICSLAEEVFGAPNKARKWLYKNRRTLNYQNAVKIMQTEPGAQLLEEELNQIDAGFIS